MSNTSLMILVLAIFTSLVYLAQVEKVKVGSLQWWKEEQKVIEQKIKVHYTKLYKSNDFNFAFYSPEEGILVIGQNSQLKGFHHWTYFRRNQIKNNSRIKTAQRVSEYRQVDPELRKLLFESNVQYFMIHLLQCQFTQKAFEDYLRLNINYIFKTEVGSEIDDPKGHLFIKEVAEKVKEEYLKLKQEKQAELTHLLTQMKDLKALLTKKINAYKQHSKKDYFSINDL